MCGICGFTGEILDREKILKNWCEIIKKLLHQGMKNVIIGCLTITILQMALKSCF